MSSLHSGKMHPSLSNFQTKTTIGKFRSDIAYPQIQIVAVYFMYIMLCNFIRHICVKLYIPEKEIKLYFYEVTIMLFNIAYGYVVNYFYVRVPGGAAATFLIWLAELFVFATKALSST